MHTDTPDSIHAEYEALVGEKLPREVYETACYQCNHVNNLDIRASIGDVLSYMIGKTWAGAICRGCSSRVGGLDFCMEPMIQDQASRHTETDLDTLAASSWFHGTATKDWDKLVAVGVINSLHAGARLTALDRVFQRRLTSVTLYELQIIPAEDAGNTITEFIKDAEDDWDAIGEGEVSPYVNDWETSGATSIYADSSRVRVVGSETIDMEKFAATVRDIRTRELAMLNIPIG